MSGTDRTNFGNFISIRTDKDVVSLASLRMPMINKLTWLPSQKNKPIKTN